MVRVLASSAIDCEYELRSCQTKEYKVGICCFSAKNAALKRKSKDWLARNQNNVSAWSNISTQWLVSPPCQRQCELLPSLGTRRPSSFVRCSSRSVNKHGRHKRFLFLIGRFKKKSSLKLLSQMNRNLVWSNYRISSIKIAHLISIRWQTWSPQTILVSDWPISNNLLLWNCLAKWAELWWEAPIAGAVCIKSPQSRMKGERHRLRPLSLYFQWAKNEYLSYYNL
jgi:hypothetical protein